MISWAVALSIGLRGLCGFAANLGVLLLPGTEAHPFGVMPPAATTVRGRFGFRGRQVHGPETLVAARLELGVNLAGCQ